MRFLWTTLLLGMLLPSTGWSLEYGLNCNAPIAPSTGQIAGSTNPTAMKETGAQWVRVNFILGPWLSPDDATRRGPENLTWYETYDRIVDGYVAQGIKVYGLIGGESVKNASRDRLNTEEFASDLAINSEKIIGHFRNRVPVYEIYNEPNDWAGGTTSQVEPYWLARYMERVYSAVKIENGHNTDPTWQAVTIVTGPLFTHDLDTGGGYLSQVFQAGTNQLGWETIKTNTGTYPFDGVGFHVYVKQGWEPDSEVISYLNRNLNAVYSALTDLEGPETTKQIYISEFGWHSGYTDEANQAHKMDVAFTVFEADTRIAQAHWFTLTDWPGSNWGIYRQEPYIPANRKPAFYTFLDHATRAPLENGASLIQHNVPVWVEPGSIFLCTVEMMNSGGTTWEKGSGTDRPYALVAGSTDLEMDTENEFSWFDFDSGGISVSPTEQSVYLDADVGPGGNAPFTFSSTAPDALPRGPKAFVASLWNDEEGVFGAPLEVYPLVAYRSDSLIQNSDFESGDLTGWTSWGQVDGAISGSWFAGVQPSHGTYFAGAAANYGTKDGGLYQTFATESGGLYGAVAMVQTYREGGASGDTVCRIGLDPSGGSDPAASTVQWSIWKESPGGWTRIGTRATATGDTMTVFLQGEQQATIWNITAFDDVIVAGPQTPIEKSAFLIY